MFIQHLTIQLFLSLMKVEMLYLGHLLEQKVSKVPEIEIIVLLNVE